MMIGADVKHTIETSMISLSESINRYQQVLLKVPNFPAVTISTPPQQKNGHVEREQAR
jgi:hypothetical protein